MARSPVSRKITWEEDEIDDMLEALQISSGAVHTAPRIESDGHRQWRSILVPFLSAKTWNPRSVKSARVPQRNPDGADGRVVEVIALARDFGCDFPEYRVDAACEFVRSLHNAIAARRGNVRLEISGMRWREDDRRFQVEVINTSADNSSIPLLYACIQHGQTSEATFGRCWAVMRAERRAAAIFDFGDSGGSFPPNDTNGVCAVLESTDRFFAANAAWRCHWDDYSPHLIHYGRYAHDGEVPGPLDRALVQYENSSRLYTGECAMPASGSSDQFYVRRTASGLSASGVLSSRSIEEPPGEDLTTWKY